MKKITTLLLLIVAIFQSFAQQTTVDDALRYSISDLNGTARFRALSGAFGAVGGDLSSININPAGSVFFAFNSATGTIGNYNVKNSSNYFGTNSTASENRFDINQLGVVFAFKNNSKSDWKKIAFALNYENTNNFDDNFYSLGTNPGNSIGNYFLNYANLGNNGSAMPIELMETLPNETITDLYSYLASLPNGNYPNLSGFAAQQAFLGYQAYLYDYDDQNNIYSSNIPGGPFFQENNVFTTGYNGKVTANLAAQYKDFLYLGLNLNGHFTDFRKTSSVYERNISTPNIGVQEIQFDNDLYTYGGGFSFNLGAIAKLSDMFRIGLAYESPTWYRLNDELAQRVTAVSTDDTNSYTDVVNPGVINIYDSYKLQTPGKFSGSLAVLFGKNGLISFDYGLKDYSQTKFSPKNSGLYNSLNNSMNNLLSTSNEFRIGGEYRIKNFSLRGGYRFEESPYKNGKTIGDLNGFSTGIGYNFGPSRIDFTYAHSQRDSDMTFVSSGMTDAARITTKNNNLLLSYTFNF